MTTTDRLRALLAECERVYAPLPLMAVDSETAPFGTLIDEMVRSLPALLEFVAIAKRAVTMFHACDRHPGVWTTCDYGDCPAYRAALAKLDGEPNPR